MQLTLVCMMRVIVISLLALLVLENGLFGQRCMVGAEHTAISQDALMAREAQLQEWIERHPVRSRANVIIPVVFHVIWHTPEENIPDAQIYSQIEAVNMAMTSLTRHPARIPEDFKGLDVTMDVQFCLATRDPQGNTTTGITRKQTEVADFGLQLVSGGRRAIHYEEYGGSAAWDQDRYINIWIVGLGGYLGFSTFPDMHDFPEEDGIILTPDAVGTIGLATAPYDEGHTLTHELGHYFNLYHLWGPETGCINDDFVADTPLQESRNEGCPSHPHVSCGSADMFMNFMDLVDDACMAMFTQGQRDRFHAALSLYRPLLMVGNALCTPTGTAIPDLASIDVFFAPTHRKIVISSQQAVADAVNLQLFSLEGRQIAAYDWTFGHLYSMDSSGLPPGMYVLVLSYGAQTEACKVLVY